MNGGISGFVISILLPGCQQDDLSLNYESPQQYIECFAITELGPFSKQQRKVGVFLSFKCFIGSLASLAISCKLSVA